ncbi:C-5 cytosine-specific DNA methylase [anaerobic digester metagenome]
MMTTEEKILDSQQIALPLPDNIGITQSSGLDRHSVYARQRVDSFRNDDIASTESARQHKDATDLVCQPCGGDSSIQLIRRLTPLECERLQGYPDGWTDIPTASDSARYKALGNSVAIPCVDCLLFGMACILRRDQESSQEV